MQKLLGILDPAGCRCYSARPPVSALHSRQQILLRRLSRDLGTPSERKAKAAWGLSSVRPRIPPDVPFLSPGAGARTLEQTPVSRQGPGLLSPRALLTALLTCLAWPASYTRPYSSFISRVCVVPVLQWHCLQLKTKARFPHFEHTLDSLKGQRSTFESYSIFLSKYILKFLLDFVICHKGLDSWS